MKLIYHWDSFFTFIAAERKIEMCKEETVTKKGKE